MNPVISFHPDGDGAYEGREVVDCGSHFDLAFLPSGMASGSDSLALGLVLPDGRTAVVQTSVAAWSAMSAAIRGRQERGF